MMDGAALFRGEFTRPVEETAGNREREAGRKLKGRRS